MKRTLELEVAILNRVRIGSKFLRVNQAGLVEFGPALDLQV